MPRSPGRRADRALRAQRIRLSAHRPTFEPCRLSAQPSGTYPRPATVARGSSTCRCFWSAHRLGRPRAGGRPGASGSAWPVLDLYSQPEPTRPKPTDAALHRVWFLAANGRFWPTRADSARRPRPTRRVVGSSPTRGANFYKVPASGARRLRPTPLAGTLCTPFVLLLFR